MNALNGLWSDIQILQIVTSKNYKRDIHKNEKKRTLLALVFLAMKIKKNVQFMYRKMLRKKHISLLFIEEEGKRHNVLIKDFNIFMYDYSLPRGRKHFCCY